MADKIINLKIITPERVLVEDQVEAVYSKAIDGEFGILPGHIPFMTPLDIGITKYKKDNEFEYVAIIGGILQVSNNNVIILAEKAELGVEIDVPRAQAAKERAEARLKSGRDIDVDRAQAALLRAITRMQAASKIKIRQ